MLSGRRKSSRRSARKQGNTGRGGSSFAGQANGCNASGRATLAMNLLNRFKDEYVRAFTPTAAANLRTNQNTPNFDHVKQQTIIGWKFQELDTNNDTMVRKKEIRELKRMVKKFVFPRECSKMFARLVDRNNDQIVSKSEWTQYFKSHSTSSESHSRVQDKKPRGGHRGRQQPSPSHSSSGGGEYNDDYDDFHRPDSEYDTSCPIMSLTDCVQF